MTRTAVTNLFWFFAGTLIAVVGVVAFNPARWHLPSFAPIEVPTLNTLVWPFSPAVTAAAVFVTLTTTLLVVYRNRARARASNAPRSTARPSAISPQPATRPEEAPSRAQTEINIVRDELERQLGKLIVLIADQLDNSKDHVDSLRNANDQLASVTTVAEIRDVVGSLISKNETNDRQTRDLEARLKEAQDQTLVLRQRLTRAEKLAALDPLTSVANRRRFEQFISAEVDSSHENGTPLCLIMTDIDHFKRVNDTYGHGAGDRVLKAFADLLSKNTRAGDLVARYGGEEFAIVLPETSMGDAFNIAEQMRCVFERKGGPDGAVVREYGRLTASFGIAEIRDGEPPSALIQRADQTLYQAKNVGRNRTVTCSTSAPAMISESA